MKKDDIDTLGIDVTHSLVFLQQFLSLKQNQKQKITKDYENEEINTHMINLFDVLKFYGYYRLINDSLVENVKSIKKQEKYQETLDILDAKTQKIQLKLAAQLQDIADIEGKSLKSLRKIGEYNLKLGQLTDAYYYTKIASDKIHKIKQNGELNKQDQLENIRIIVNLVLISFIEKKLKVGQSQIQLATLLLETNPNDLQNEKGFIKISNKIKVLTKVVDQFKSYSGNIFLNQDNDNQLIEQDEQEESKASFWGSTIMIILFMIILFTAFLTPFFIEQEQNKRPNDL